MQKDTKLGIVLSGGGAKGAYEAGFLKALAELNIQPDVIAGTSIGALNGALYSAQRETFKSAKTIEKLWSELANDNVLKVDSQKAMKNLIEVFSYFSPLPVSKLAKIVMVATKAGKSEEGILSQVPIVNRLQEYAPEDKLSTGLPFYVGLTPSKENLQDVVNFLGFGKEEAIFKKIQEVPIADMHKIIMASAALPILFDAIEVENGKTYRDGCLGSTDNEWGNTPAKPLIEKEKCTHIIVCHLNEGSFFNRHDSLFKDIPIIEIRPEKGTFTSALDPVRFSVDKIGIWMKQGYEDSIRILSDSFQAIQEVEVRKVTEKMAQDSLNRLNSREFKLGK